MVNKAPWFTVSIVNFARLTGRRKCVKGAEAGEAANEVGQSRGWIKANVLQWMPGTSNSLSRRIIVRRLIQRASRILRSSHGIYGVEVENGEVGGDGFPWWSAGNL